MRAHTISAALLVVSLTSAAAGIPTEDWPFRPAEFRRLESEHAGASEGLAALLDGVERRRNAYKGSTDPEAALNDWAKDLNAASLPYQHVVTINDKIKEGLAATEMYLVVKAVSVSKTSDNSYSKVSPEYMTLSDAGNRIDVYTRKLRIRHGEERDRLKDAKKEHARATKQAAENRLIVGSLAAAAAFFLALAAWVKRRPKPPSTSPVIRL